VTIQGPKGSLSNVVVLGPERTENQVEVSKTDCVTLGISAPVRLSGQIQGTPGVILRAGERTLPLEQGLLVAQRHLHMTPEDARRFGLENGQLVSLKTLTDRPVRFEEVPVRISSQSATAAHLDYDEANACGFRPGDRGVILP
jgi:propanediol utilization protein